MQRLMFTALRRMIQNLPFVKHTSAILVLPRLSIWMHLPRTRSTFPVSNEIDYSS
jgi:hypothetical protein